MVKIFSRYLLVLSFVLTTVALQATHIRGGQIFYKRVNSFTAELTFVGYRDSEGVLFGQGIFDFGDGNVYGDEPDETIPWVVTEDLQNGIERWEFTLAHTYSSSGSFIASYREDFRTASVQNISGSLNTTFYVEANVLLDQLIDNSSPGNYGIPDMIAVAGTRFTSNLMMFDEEGDSLSYGLVTPQESANEQVDGYVFPSDLSFYDDWISEENPTYSIDPISGNLEWDVPTLPGLYSVAVKTVEWRKINGEYFNIGYTKIDYLIEVLSIPAVHSVVVPESSCQSVNTNYSKQVVITNDQNAELSISIHTELNKLKFNGLTSEEWNEQSQFYSTEEIIIDVELSMDDASAFIGLNLVYISVTGGSDFVSEPITTSVGFVIGIGCSSDDLIVLGIGEEKPPVLLNISKMGIEINSDQTRRSTVHIFDSNGKRLLKSNVLLTEGDNTLNFPFNYYQPYFILLDYKKGRLSEKVLLTK